MRKLWANILLALLLATCAFAALTHFKPPTSDQIRISDRLYVRIAAVYAGNIDSRFVLSHEVLETCGPTFLDKPILMGHDWKDPQVCIGRITSVGIRFDKELKVHYLEIVAYIDGRDAIDRVTRGLFYSVSIGMSDIKATCLLDGIDILIDQRHETGRHYNVEGKAMPARAVLQKFAGREVSFVNVPGSPNARVLEWSHSPLKLSESK